MLNNSKKKSACEKFFYLNLSPPAFVIRNEKSFLGKIFKFSFLFSQQLYQLLLLLHLAQIQAGKFYTKYRGKNKISFLGFLFF